MEDLNDDASEVEVDDGDDIKGRPEAILWKIGRFYIEYVNEEE